jgi:hypothetical protein
MNAEGSMDKNTNDVAATTGPALNVAEVSPASGAVGDGVRISGAAGTIYQAHSDSDKAVLVIDNG